MTVPDDGPTWPAPPAAPAGQWSAPVDSPWGAQPHGSGQYGSGQYGAAADAQVDRPADERLSAGSTRVLSTPMPEVRAVLLGLVRQLDFEISVEQYSVIEAARGTRMGGLTLSPSRVPVTLRIDLDPDDSGTKVGTRLDDRWGVPVGRHRGAGPVYAGVFRDTLTAIDTALSRLDPVAGRGFDDGWRNYDEAALAGSSGVAQTAARAENMVSKRSARLLEGPQNALSRSATGEAGVQTVLFTGPDAAAEIAADDVDAMLTAGQLVSARPGTMPANLVKSVQQFTVALEDRLDPARTGPGYGSQVTTIPLEAELEPVVTFLFQQAKLREQLPMRILMVCTTCRLEKIVNPDLTRMRERARRTKVLTGSIGMVFGSHHVSPYILLGKLVQLKKSDPDFVCVRCQGMDADQTLVTFCSKCGDRRGETVLRTCPKCAFDFRTLLPKYQVWRDPGEVAAATSDPNTTATVPWPVPAASVVPAVTSTWPTTGLPTTDLPRNDRPTADQSASVPPPAVGAPTATWAAPTRSAYGSQQTTSGGQPIPSTLAPLTEPAAPTVPANWYPDPYQRFQFRYWDGWQWTIHVSTDGASYTDALG